MNERLQQIVDIATHTAEHGFGETDLVIEQARTFGTILALIVKLANEIALVERRIG